MTKNQKKISMGAIMLAVIFMFFTVGTLSVKAEEENVATETVSTEASTEAEITSETSEMKPTETGTTEATSVETVATEVASTEVPLAETAGDTTGAVKLATPQNVSISDNWVFTFDVVPEAQGYTINVRRNGEYVGGSSAASEQNIKDGKCSINLFQYIHDSGTYSVVVNAWDDNKEYSDFSEEVQKDYIKPETSLGTTVGAWDKNNIGTFIFNSVKDAVKYQWNLYQKLPDGTTELKYWGYVTAKAGETQSRNFSSWFESHDAGQYVVTICALSGNVNEISHGVEGEASEVFDSALLKNKTQLATPQNVSVSDDWLLTFDEVPETQGHYMIVIERNGERVTSIHRTVYNKNGYSISEYISETGIYSFTVTALNNYDPNNYTSSEPSEPVIINYVKPEAQLGTTVARWDKENPGTVVFDSVSSAQRYGIYLYQIQGDVEQRRVWSIMGAREENVMTYDVTSWFERYGAGKYVVTIRALSSNVNEIANGVEGETSDVFDTANMPTNIIDDAINSTATAAEALETITQNISKDTLGLSMQTNDKALEQMKTLEEQYADENGITVTKSVSEEASEYVASDKVSMVGAGLNAEAGNISLDISVPKAPVDISGEKYAKSVQLDIKLLNGDTEIHDLKVPVTITIPVPQGLEAKHLILIHYHDSGKLERVIFKDNGNGMVTFTVKDFSVFVFAQNETENETTKPDESGSGAENKPDEPRDEESSNEEVGDETTDALKSPKTSDNSSIGLLGVLFMISLMVLVFMVNGKKKEHSL